MLTIYHYPKCSTCRNAIKHLDAAGVEYKAIDITEKPPSKATLKAILKTTDEPNNYTLKDLFNKSGVLYREMKMKDKLPSMSETDAIALLAANGKLIKRPIVSDGKKFTVGFKKDVFEKVWG